VRFVFPCNFQRAKVGQQLTIYRGDGRANRVRPFALVEVQLLTDIDWKFWSILVLNATGVGFMAWQIRIMKNQIVDLPSPRSARRVAAERALTRRMYVPVMLMALLVILSWLPYVFQKPQPDVFPPVLSQWGGTAESCSAVIDTASFVGAAQKYRVFDVCHIMDPSVDEMDSKVAVSAPFTITGGQVTIVTHYDPASDIGKEMGKAAKSSNLMVGHSVVLLPKDDDGTDIRKLRARYRS
jgi:hypothetical protein